tara:strand:+ start:511 stop:1590 length:1080 start_codon:yes stop_codon:yes gene_type:complete
MKKISDHYKDIKTKGYKEIYRKIRDFYSFVFLQRFNRFFFIFYLALKFANHKKKNFNNNKLNRIIICSVMWGAYKELFIKFGLTSLLSNKNIPLLIERGFKIKFIIATIPNPTFENQVLNKLQSTLSKDNFEIEFHYYEKMESDKIKQYLIKIYEQSVKEDTIIWPANPDHSYSDGSISNVISMMDSDDCCIAAPIFRVDEDSFKKQIQSNDGLLISHNDFINISIKCFHKSLIKSFVEETANNSWLTGISIKQLQNKNLLVTDIVPNVFAARMNKSDIKFFQNKSYNAFDMSWPSKLLIEKRLRIVPSSDIFFAAELTDKNQHIDYNYTLKFNPRNDLKRNLHSNVMGSFTYLINCYK